VKQSKIHPTLSAWSCSVEQKGNAAACAPRSTCRPARKGCAPSASASRSWSPTRDTLATELLNLYVRDRLQNHGGSGLDLHEQAGEAIRRRPDARAVHEQDVLQVSPPVRSVGGDGGHDGPQDSGVARLPKRRVSAPTESRSHGRRQHRHAVLPAVRGQAADPPDDGGRRGVPSAEHRAVRVVRLEKKRGALEPWGGRSHSVLYRTHVITSDVHSR